MTAPREARPVTDRHRERASQKATEILRGRYSAINPLHGLDEAITQALLDFGAAALADAEPGGCEAREMLAEIEGHLLDAVPQSCSRCAAHLDCLSTPTCATRRENHLKALSLIRTLTTPTPARPSAVEGERERTVEEGDRS